jgi:hypothetical protein
VALIVFLAMRVALSLYAAAILSLRPIPAGPDEKVRPYLGVSPVNEGAAGLFLGAWQRFDALHYQRIADRGYISPDDTVFPPLYPLLVRLAGALLGGDSLLGGLLVSNLACLGLFVLLHRLATDEWGEQVASRAVIFLAVFPTSFFLLAPYSESLFCMLVVAAFYWARKGKWLAAGLGAALAALTRLTGWVLLFPLLYEYLRQRDFSGRKIGFGLLAPLAAPLALVAFLFFRAWRDMPPLSQVYLDYWRQKTALPGVDVVNALAALAGGRATFILVLNLAAVLLFAWLTAIVLRRSPPAYGIYTAVTLLFLLSTVSIDRPLNAMIRYVLTLFPAFIVLGQMGARPWPNRLIVYPSLALLIYLAGQFVMWGWVA